MNNLTKKLIEDDLVKAERDFKKNFGREINEPAKQEVLNEGDSNCKHLRVFYIDNAFDGQAFWCDGCKRHERMDYSPRYKIKFPPNALISTPNPKYGGEKFYCCRANEKGVVEKILDRISWIERKR